MSMYKSTAQLELEQQFPNILKSLQSWILAPAQNTRGSVLQQPPSIQNGKLVPGTSFTNTPIDNFSATALINKSQPVQTSPFLVNTPIGDLEPFLNDNSFSRNLLQGTTDTSSLLNQANIENSQSSKEYVSPQQPKTNILGEQIPMEQLPKSSGYINNKLFDSSKQPIHGMFDGYSKERDASLNSYGKVDKDSDFYKRNKKAMSNLGKPIEKDSQAQQQNNAMIYNNPTSASIDFKSLSPNKPRKIYGVV